MRKWLRDQHCQRMTFLYKISRRYHEEGEDSSQYISSNEFSVHDTEITGLVNMAVYISS